ncbi:MAG TPA: DUF1844 domain-containing protein [Anaeromyxobacteraceae bacterium]|nr:DUF1844 domain-containing protein [Anaeromyxobacteraceae bacterium]
MAEPKQAIDFYTFVLSLGSSAFIHLGDAPHPETGELLPVNLSLAQQTIDILSMLREKTKGNLTPEEEKFLENLLTDLRLRFVSKSQGKAE